LPYMQWFIFLIRADQSMKRNVFPYRMSTNNIECQTSAEETVTKPFVLNEIVMIGSKNDQRNTTTQ
jgi:hypothetical protein